MPFDPAQPITGSPFSSQVVRDQFNALKALLDGLPVVATGRVVADWTAEIVLHVISGPSGQGLKFRVNGPGAGSVLIAIQGTGGSGSTAIECEVQTAFAVAAPTRTFCAGSNLTGVVRIHVVITGSSPGTVQLQASNSSGGGTVTIKASSDLVARRRSS